jgi:peptidyl-prolyl cis-trans isomerase A (cyclophilin A)
MTSQEHRECVFETRIGCDDHRSRSVKLWILGTALALTSPLQAEPSRVVFDTDRGAIFLELDDSRAPANINALLAQLEEGFFDGKVFHHSEPGYVVFGSRNHLLSQRLPSRWTEVDESDNGLLNVPRSVGVRFGPLSEFSRVIDLYFNIERNEYLDGMNPVIGTVTGGWETVLELSALKTWSFLDLATIPSSPLTIRRAFQFDRYPVLPIHSGSWFDPQSPGVGFNLEVTNQNMADYRPILILYWYDFSQGEPLWLTGSAGFEWGEDAVTVELLAVPTPNVAADFQSPPDAGAFQRRGTITIGFNDCMTGRFSYNLPDFGTGEIDVMRLTVPDRVDCKRYQLNDE